MSSFLTSLLPSRRRFFGFARLSLALLVILPHLAHAQRGAGRAGAGGTAAGGAFTGGGGRRGGGVRGVPAAAAAAGTDPNAITTTVAVPAGGQPGAGPNVNGAAQFGPNAVPVGVVGKVPDQEELIIVNMPGNSAPEVFEWLQRNTGKIILQNQTLDTVKLIFSTDAGPNNAMPRKEAVKAVELMLAMDGVVLIPMGDNYLRAERAASIPGLGLPEATDADLAGTEPSGAIMGHFFKLQYVTPDAAAQRIGPFLSAKGTADSLGLARENTIYVADVLTNLRNVASLLKHFDAPADLQEEIIYRPLANSSAQTVVTSLTALQAGPMSKILGNADTTLAGSATAFYADTRTNSIIVYTNKGNRAMIKTLLDEIDQEFEPTTKTQVFQLNQANATTLNTTINSMITGIQTATGVGRGGAGAGGPGLGAAAGGAGGAATSAARDGQFSPYVTIQPDARTNSIVAYGTPSDLHQIASLISQVDTILPQAHIDVVVTEVTLTKDQATGLSAFNIDYGFTAGSSTNGTTTPATVGGAKTYSTTGPTAQNAITSPAFTINGVLTSWNLNAVFNVARANSNVKVLSNPNLTVTHAQTGNISVGESIPVINSTAANLNTTTTLTSTITYRNVAIGLQVTPLIGKDGSVNMNITQTVDDVVSEVSINGNNQPVIGSRTITSNVTVHDGDVLVLGGLRSRAVSATHGIVFLLGEIPILGSLFQPDTYDSTQRELIVFIKPTIVKSSSDVDTMSRELAQNSVAADLSTKYLRDRNLSDAGLEEGTAMETPASSNRGPDTDHAPIPTSAKTVAPVLTPASSGETPAAPATPVSSTPAPAPETPAPAPASTPAPAPAPTTSSQPNPTTRGFNK